MVSSQSSAGAAHVKTTSRKDWDSLVDELYASVISGAPFGIGIATKHRGLLGSSIKLRLNQRFPQPKVAQFIRQRFQAPQLDRVFQSGAGLEYESAGMYKVVGDDVGLPRNCLLVCFANAADPSLRGVMMFGGQRLEGQLEKRLEAASGVLRSTGRSSPFGGLTLESRDDLLTALNRINVKRLFDYDMEVLARIVNGLEHTKDELPKQIKPIFKAVSDYIIKHRVKQHR